MRKPSTPCEKLSLAKIINFAHYLEVPSATELDDSKIMAHIKIKS
jgi:hypothetical protein